MREDNVSPRSIVEVDDELGPEGCYLVYEPDSGGRLMIVYSHGYVPMIWTKEILSNVQALQETFHREIVQSLLEQHESNGIKS